MPRVTPASRAEHVFILLVALLFPSLSLIVLGGFYLWEKGWLLYWALGALGIVAFTYFFHAIALKRASPPRSGQQGDPAQTALSGSEGADPNWSRAEREAWADVEKIAAGVDLDRITDPKAAWDVAFVTIEAVARRLHTDSHDAVWRFTLPEALAISERVSRRLGYFVATHVPFGERLTVAQILTIYRSRQLIDVAGRAYDVWRVVRLMNPATALTNEARERLGRALFNWGREHVTRRLAEAYIEEVGRAAIDLYGGRLRVAASSEPNNLQLEQYVGPSSAAPVGTVRQAARAVKNLAGSMLRRRR